MVALRTVQLERKGSPRGRVSPNWSEAEVETLMEYWGREPMATVARRVRRSVYGYRQKAVRLGINQQMAWWSCNQVGALFGVESSTVRRWVAKGLLSGRRLRHIGSGGDPRWPRKQLQMWGFDGADIERFIEEHPEAYDYRRIPKGTYHRQLAEAAYDADPLLSLKEVAKRLSAHVSRLRIHIRRGWLPAVWAANVGPGMGNRGWLVRESDLGCFRDRRKCQLRRPLNEAQLRAARANLLKARTAWLAKVAARKAQQEGEKAL